MSQTTAALSWGQVLAIALIVGISVLVAGGIVAYARSQDPESPRGSLIRSWMAISLVMGLLLFCGFAMALPDPTLRSTLIGALAASAGTAIAYYFSSKASEEARKDIMNAAFGTVKVPDLVGKTMTEATAASGAFQLGIDPGKMPAGDDATITAQDPATNSTARAGSTIKVSF